MNRELGRSVFRSNFLSIATFKKWFDGWQLRHKLMLMLGLFVFVLGFVSVILAILGWGTLGLDRITLSIGGLYLSFGGVVLLQIVIRFVLASRSGES